MIYEDLNALVWQWFCTARSKEQWQNDTGVLFKITDRQVLKEAFFVNKQMERTNMCHVNDRIRSVGWGEPIYYRIGRVWLVPPPLLYSLCMLYYMYK